MTDQNEQSQRLSADEMRHIASLVRIGMTDEDIETMRGEMSHILDNIDVLNEVDTEGVEPTGHAVDVVSVMREDEIRECLSKEDVLKNAPRQQDGFIRVKAVLE